MSDENGLSEHDRRELKVSLKHYFERLLLEHEKAHQQLAENVRVALAAQDKRLDGMNEFRRSLEDFQARAVPREMFDQRAESVDTRLNTIERNIVGREAFRRDTELRDAQIDSLNAFRAKAAGAAIVLMFLSGFIGAAISRIVWGGS